MIVSKSKIKKEELIYPIKFYLRNKVFIKDLIVHVDENQCMDFLDWLNRNKYTKNIQSWDFFVFDDIKTKENIVIMRNEIQAFKMPRLQEIDADNYKIELQLGGF
ncbi:hypothetical protein SAMN05443428_13918 [Caloramator quimbayensis]|uniref:Uncharacterized protein n=1 Tax=Caloramator quimbayensis TaxID=1147123 RepID=A0A1T4YEG5_9CLOT|nr:hypothetical protein [Caloramator quimbayensis]SKA99938.1 hypothetical protein SAMN05443428_13918 [Caloramator quimbayensis]